MQIYRLIYYF